MAMDVSNDPLVERRYAAESRCGMRVLPESEIAVAGGGLGGSDRERVLTMRAPDRANRRFFNGLTRIVGLVGSEVDGHEPARQVTRSVSPPPLRRGDVIYASNFHQTQT